MSHCKCKKNGSGKTGKQKAVPFRKKGYGTEYLPDGRVHVFVPEKDNQRFVYISPMGGSDDQALYAKQVQCFARKAWENEEIVPVNPYLMYGEMFKGAGEKATNMIFTFTVMILMQCDELWIIDDGKSELRDYQKFEMTVAREMNIPTLYFEYTEEDEDE